MTSVGWEIFSVKISTMLTMLASSMVFMMIWFGVRKHEDRHLHHVDTMAGEE